MSLEDLFKTRQSDGILVPLLNEHLLLEGQKPSGRSTGVFHPSEVSGFFCPRQWVIIERHRGEFVKEGTPPGLMRTFSIGHKLHEMMQEFISQMGLMYGNYKCKGCKNIYLGFKPDKCGCGSKKFTYEEVKVQDEEKHVDGHTDGLVVIGNFDNIFGKMPKKYIFEFKTINSVGFKNLRKPIEAHREQGGLYLTVLERNRKKRLQELEESGIDKESDVWKVESLPFEGVLIIYMDKGQQAADGLSDLKEYFLEAKEAKKLIEAKFPLMDEAWAHFTSEEKTYPARICQSRTEGHKCKCPKQVIDYCFATLKDK
jgi:hypothetical protein